MTTVVSATAGFGSSIAVMSREVVRLGGDGTDFDPEQHAVVPFEAAKIIDSVGSPGIEPVIARSKSVAAEDFEPIVSIAGWPDIDLVTIKLGPIKVRLQAFASDNLPKLNFVQRS